MDLDSLLPPALSESLHIPPWLPWLAEAQFLIATWLLDAVRGQKDCGQKTHKNTCPPRKCNYTVSCLGDILSISFSYFQRQIFQLWWVRNTRVSRTLLAMTTFPWIKVQCLQANVTQTVNFSFITSKSDYFKSSELTWINVCKRYFWYTTERHLSQCSSV